MKTQLRSRAPQEISTLYNEWAEMGADVEEEEDEPEDEEEDEYEEGDEEEEEEDDDEEETPPPAKKAKRAEAPPPAPYVLPTATSLATAAATVLAPHLNLSRAEGETKRMQPYYGSVGEHFCVVNVTHGDDED